MVVLALHSASGQAAGFLSEPFDESACDGPDRVNVNCLADRQKDCRFVPQALQKRKKPKMFHVETRPGCGAALICSMALIWTGVDLGSLRFEHRRVSGRSATAHRHCRRTLLHPFRPFGSARSVSNYRRWPRDELATLPWQGQPIAWRENDSCASRCRRFFRSANG